MMRLEFGKSAVEARFEAYVERLGEVLGHADRLTPFGGYVSGLFLPVARKSVEPMAARLAPANTSAVHQSLLHFVGESPWRDDRVLEAIRDQVLPVLEAAGGIEAWIIDDTSFPKKGRHSVGVARQYCGQLGKTENCQVAVSLSLASARASLPVALASVPARGLGRGRGAAPQDRHSRRHRFPHQARDRPGADPRGTVHGPARPASPWPTRRTATTPVSATS